MNGLPFICGITPKPQAKINAKRDLALHSKKYRRSKKAEFYGVKDEMVDDYRNFLYKEVDRLRKSYYYNNADIDMTDFSEIVEAMCAEYRTNLKLKPVDILLGELRRHARLTRIYNWREFKGDLELYRVFLSHRLFECLRYQSASIFGNGKDDILRPPEQAEVVKSVTDEEIETLRLQLLKGALV